MGRAGDYNKLFDLRRQSEAVDSIGGVDHFAPWSTVRTLWCALEISNSAKTREYGADRGTVYATIRIQNLPAVLSTDRLRYNGEVWRIESLYRDEDEDEIVCDCIRLAMDDE